MIRLTILDKLFLFSLFLLFAIAPTDPDLGWHLRCGQQIWQNHSLCRQNQFSVLLANYSWVNHYWLYQAVAFPLFKYLHVWSLTLLNSLVMGIAFSVLYLAIPGRRLEKMIAIILIILLGWGVFSFGIRSQLLGFLFFNLALLANSFSQKRAKVALILPLILFLWAQAHASVVFGVVLAAFLIMQKIIEQKNRSGFFFLILLLSFSATLINPFGLKIYEEVWRHFAVASLDSQIAEWVPPLPAIRIAIISSGLTPSFFLIIAKQTKDKVLVVITLLFAFASLKARRNLPFYLILFFYFLLTSNFDKIFARYRPKIRNLKKNLAIITTVAVFSFGLFIQLPKTIKENLAWRTFLENSSLSYPFSAVDFLKNQAEKGNLFNRYEWGGFLIWQLPEYKIFVDGRMPAWKTPSGKSPYTIYLEILQTQTGWQEILSQYQINWILISPGTFMDILLRPQPQKFGWKEVYRDKTSVIYGKLKLPL